MRADGTSFLLKFSAGAGLTYQVLAILRAGSAAAHLRLAIFPPEAIGSASSTGAASESSCELPPAAQGLQSKDVTEMTFGTWGSPVHGQSWGDQHRCADLTRVGPPEQGGCDGQYRYFPGQSFPSNYTWDWTAPFTANYVLQVTANCDVPFYDDPTQPGCTVTADGIECDDDRVTQCAAAIGLTIRVVDRSVHVKHTFDIPVTQEVLNSVELQQRMADMFALQQQPAIVFPLSISPLDCGLAKNAERLSCQQAVDPGPGGGHRRRRLQTQIGADIDHACPQSSFDARDTAMRAACDFQSSDAADPLLQGQCPSLECARALLPLLEDCAEHIVEFARHIGPEAAFYEALGRSELFNSCLEMDQSAAKMASVQVEFRAPTLQVANQMIAEHQQMVSEMFLPTSESVGRQHLCFGNPDASVGDGSRCGGRRQLGGEGLCAEVCADKDEEIRRLKAELEKSRAETELAVQRSAEKDQIIEQQTKKIEKQGTEIAFHKRLHRLRQNAVITQKVSDSTRRNQTAVGRRAQVIGTSDSSVLRSARVGPDRLVKACAVHPCELSDGICQNGGTCVEVAAEGGGAVPFECQCVGNFGEARCETNLCAGVDCGEHGECAAGACECSDDWTGDRCETAPRAFFTVVSGPCTVSEAGRCVGRPDGYLPNEDCEIMVGGDTGGVLGLCPVFNVDPRKPPTQPDWLALPDGSQRSGGDCPAGTFLGLGQTLMWHSSDQSQGTPFDGVTPGGGDVPRPDLGFGGEPFSEHGVGGGWQICSTKLTTGLPAWDSEGLANPAGLRFVLYLLPEQSFINTADEQHYVAACESYGLRPVVTGDTSWGRPGTCETDHCMQLPEAWGSGGLLNADGSGGGAGYDTIRGNTGWHVPIVILSDGASVVDQRGGSGEVTGIANSIGGWNRDTGWDTLFHPVCALAVPPELTAAGVSAAQYRVGLAAGVDRGADAVCFGEYTEVPDDFALTIDAGQAGLSSYPNYDATFAVPNACRQDIPVRTDSASQGGAFQLHGGPWYRLPPGYELPRTHPGWGHCGTHATGWLSDWTGPDAPSTTYDIAASGTLPPPVGSSPIGGWVCFDGTGPDGRFSAGSCAASTAIRAVSCGQFELWELPPLPEGSAGCDNGYCLAADPCFEVECAQHGHCVGGSCQ
eukprot:SAG11_NODE_231_length_11932_cov_40.992817_4_plen_1147_part_00